MIVTFLSDTHTKHRYCEEDLYKGQGDLLIHAGDIMNSGNDEDDIWEFLDWFDKQNYDHLVFIAGNHDRYFEDKPGKSREIVRSYKNANYLQDDWIKVGTVESMAKIYGSPWQPEFYNWAFNLPRNGEDLREKWSLIPSDTDILVTHGPPWGHLDVSPYGNLNVGCELLRVRVDEFKPKIHVFGHVHSGYGYKFDGHTHFFNASVLNERYNYKNKPITIDWDMEHNTINFI